MNNKYIIIKNLPLYRKRWEPMTRGCVINMQSKRSKVVPTPKADVAFKTFFQPMRMGFDLFYSDINIIEFKH